MIELYTGAPGSCKTASIVDYILGLQLADKLPPLYQHGIRDLTIPHEYLVCDAPKCKPCKLFKEENSDSTKWLHAEHWDEYVPSESLVILDEIQFIFRNRPAGSKVPPGVQAFEIHRHDGTDIIIASQGANLVDQNIRTFISKHTHLLNKFGRRQRFEWPEYQQDTKSRSKAISSTFKFPKRVKGLYFSAEKHTKLRFRIPWQVFALIAIIGILVFMYFRITGKNQDEVAETTESSAVGRISSESITTDLFDFEPTVDLTLESAPAYLNQVSYADYPKNMYCMAGKKSEDRKERCQCYTQQLTKYPTTFQACMDIVNRRTFNPYISDSSGGGSRQTDTAGNMEKDGYQ